VVLGWRTTFLLCAAASVAMALLALRLLPPVAGSSAVAPLRLRQVLRLPGLALLVTVTALTMLGHFSFITYVAPFLLHAGLPETGIGPALAGSGVVGVLGLLMAGAFVDRRPRAAMLAGAGTLVTAFAVLAIFGTSVVPAVLATSATGLALGSLPIFLQTATLRAAPAAPEQASALNASAFNVGIGGGALLGGAALDSWGPGALPVLACVLTGLGLLALGFHRGLAPAAPNPA
jgi:DHA1 family inner membrane transport protein